MGPVQAIKTCFAKSLDFSGRAGRADIWWFNLFQLGIPLAAFLIVDAAILGVNFEEVYTSAPGFELVALLLLVPSIAVAMRRLHDIGWPAVVAPFAYCGICLTSYANSVFKHSVPGWVSQGETLLIAAVFPGKPGPNSYGPNLNEVPQ